MTMENILKENNEVLRLKKRDMS